MRPSNGKVVRGGLNRGDSHDKEVSSETVSKIALPRRDALGLIKL